MGVARSGRRWSRDRVAGRVGGAARGVRRAGFDAVKDEAFTSLRKVGMNKERRVDPQVTVGLLTDATGFPVQVHLFKGNKAETKTLIPVLTAFRERHAVRDIVVVADAGMLSAANLLALEEPGLRSSSGPGSARPRTTWPSTSAARATCSPTGSASRPPAPWAPGRPLGSGGWCTSTSSSGPSTTTAINAMIARAEKVADGTRRLQKDRFVKIEGATKGVDWDLVERARFLAGLKGYVTNIPAETMTGPQVTAAYHDLYQVERSFRMAKSDLAARPVFHRIRPSVEAHLTVVFAALAVSRAAQAATGLSIRKIITTLRPLRSATVTISGATITVPPRIPAEVQAILDDLRRGGY